MFTMRPLSNITPFTYSDGLTYLQVLNGLRSHLSDVLTPEFSRALEDTYNDFVAGMESYHEGMIVNVDQFNELFTDYVGNVETRFSELAEPAARDAVDTYLADPTTLEKSVTPIIDARVAPATVRASDYCAEDGVTDDGPGLNQAFAALIAAGGGKLVLTPGVTYYVNTDVVVIAPGLLVSVEGNGATLQAGPDARQVLHILGTLVRLPGAENSYTATTVGSYNLIATQNMNNDISTDDLLLVWSNDIDNPERPSDYLAGEFVKAHTVTGGSIVLDRPIRLVHTAAKNRRLYRVDSVSVQVRDLTLKSHDQGFSQRLLEIGYADGVDVERVDASGKSTRYGILVSQSLNVRVNACNVHDMWDSNNPAEPLGYGIAFTGVTKGSLTNSTGSRVRHVFDIGSYSTATLPGTVAMDIVASDCSASLTWASAWATHHARHVIFNRLTALSCGGAFIMRAIGWAVRDGVVEGGINETPAEWTHSRAVPSVLNVGENAGFIPSGTGLAGTDVVIDNLRTSGIPADWSHIRWVDPPGAMVSITGPGIVNAPGVIMSDSANRADGPLGVADLAHGGTVDASGWEWSQSGTAGVEIMGQAFGRPASATGVAVSTRTPVNVPANVEVSATWTTVGTPASMVGLIARSDAGGSNFYGFGVRADGSVDVLKRVAGAIATLTTAPAGTVLSGDQVALRVIGRRIQVMVNGGMVATANDGDLTGTGRAGFFFRSAGGDGWRAADFMVKTI